MGANKQSEPPEIQNVTGLEVDEADEILEMEPATGKRTDWARELPHVYRISPEIFEPLEDEPPPNREKRKWWQKQLRHD
jgi:hypothetical protein